MPCGASTSIQYGVYHGVSEGFKLLIILLRLYRRVSPFICQWLHFGTFFCALLESENVRTSWSQNLQRTSFSSARSAIKPLSLENGYTRSRSTGLLHLGYSQMPSCHGRGRGFEPRHPSHTSPRKSMVYGKWHNQDTPLMVLTRVSMWFECKLWHLRQGKPVQFCSPFRILGRVSWTT